MSAGVDQDSGDSMLVSWLLLTLRYTSCSDWLITAGMGPLNMLLDRSACRKVQYRGTAQGHNSKAK